MGFSLISTFGNEIAALGTGGGGGGAGRQFFAATTGVATNAGTLAAPWDLTTAMAGGFPAATLRPGDTVNIRAGTYTGLWVSTVNGNGAAPITFQNYQNEHVIFDGYSVTTLTAAVTDGVVTSIPMAKLNIPDGAFIDIDSETIRIHGYSAGNYVGVDRGWNGTTATSHLIGATVRTESGSCLTASNYNWFRANALGNMECTVSVSRFANRVNPQAGSNPFGRDAIGIDLNGNGNKAIAIVVHDCSDGITTANAVANNWEYDGCLVYYTGWDASDRGHGHNMYLHNDNPGSSTGRATACVGLSAFDIGTQVYTGGSVLGNVIVDQCVMAQSGVLSATFGSQDDWLAGMNPANTATFLTISNSASYNAVGTGNIGIDWGYQGSPTAIDHPTMTGNVFANQGAACVYKTMTNDVCTGNTFIGPSSAPVGGNTTVGWKPVSGKTFVIMKSARVSGLAFIAVYNWDHSLTVNLDLSSIMPNGTTYVIRNAWNYYGTAITSGTWNGTPFSVNTSGYTIATPVGKSAPAETGTEFNIYCVSKT